MPNAQLCNSEILEVADAKPVSTYMLGPFLEMFQVLHPSQATQNSPDHDPKFLGAGCLVNSLPDIS